MTYRITSARTKSITIADPDGYELTFDGDGVAETDDQWIAAYFATLGGIGYAVVPTPPPLPSLPPRPRMRPSMPPPPAARPRYTQSEGDLGLSFSEEEQIPNLVDRRDVVNPENSPVVPEVMAAALCERYPALADRAAIVQGLMSVDEFVTHVAEKTDDVNRVRMFRDLFPEIAARLQELEKAHTEREAGREPAQPEIDSGRPKGRRSRG